MKNQRVGEIICVIPSELQDFFTTINYYQRDRQQSTSNTIIGFPDIKGKLIYSRMTPNSL
jgi:hypothetical protein